MSSKCVVISLVSFLVLMVYVIFKIFVSLARALSIILIFWKSQVYFIDFLYCFLFSLLLASALIFIIPFLLFVWVYFALHFLNSWGGSWGLWLKTFLRSTSIYCSKFPSQNCFSCVTQILIFHLTIILIHHFSLEIPFLTHELFWSVMYSF